MASDKEPLSHRPEPMPGNTPRRRTVTIVALIVGAIIIALCAATLLGVFQSPAWTQS